MKIGKGNFSAVFKGLCFAVVVLLLAGISVRAWSDDTPGGGAKAPAAAGGYVEDPTANVPTNAFVTFSTLYNGKRYYLGVDTVLAKAGKDTVTYYESANYATMWIAGPMWSPTGAALPNKDYTRTVKSVWLAERVSRERYLALGTGSGTYSTLRLLAEGTMWHTTKDDREASRYINGFLYYYSNATGVDVYRYLRYDPVYGFSRLYAEKPAASQRISVWDRKTGSDLVYRMTPNTITFGYSEVEAIQPITSQVTYYTDVDRFRSRFDQTDVYARRSEPITDQETLIAEPYNLVGHYEWKSNPIDHDNLSGYDGNSLMPYYTITGYTAAPDPEPVWGWQNLPVVHARQNGFKLKGNIWYDTLYAVPSAIDDPEGGRRFLRKPADSSAPVEGSYVNQNDWLYTHFTCDDKEYIDSVYVVFQAFHKEASTTLNMMSDPEDYVFPYSYNNKLYDGTTSVQLNGDTAQTFNVSAKYTSGYKVVSSIGKIVETYAGTQFDLDMSARDPYNDGGVIYNSLIAEAFEPDGVTPCTWIENVRVVNHNQVRVKVKQYNPDATENRIAQIRLTYRYRNMVDDSDRASATRAIWITQEWKDAHSTESHIYAFSYKNTDAGGLQAVHEKHNTFYAIPGEDLSLPLHRDHWGYYRWFNYDEGATRGRDITYMRKWTYSEVPTNKNENEFMLINNTTASSSRGRWDIIKDINNPGNTDFGADHFEQWIATPVPAVSYPANEEASLIKNGKIACDVSEYFDVATTGSIGALTAMTEPTLSYRQVFDIQPAKTRADQLAEVKGNGSGANWLETHTIVAPAGREFHLQPQCPIADGTEAINEEHLQYIYYANPTESNAGTRTGLTDVELQKNRYYARVGKQKKINKHIQLTLLTYSYLTTTLGKNGSVNNIILVNPRNGTGLLIGHNGSETPIYLDYRPYRASRAQLEEDLARKLESGNYSSYYLTIQRNGTTNQFVFKKGSYKLFDLYTFLDLGGGLWREYNVRWYNGDPTGSEYFTLNRYAGSFSDSSIPSGYTSGDMLTFYSNWGENIPWTLFYKHNKGYLKGENPVFCDDVTEENAQNPYYGWLIYKVETISDKTFEEIPRWEKSTDGSTWQEVARWDYANSRSVSPAGVSGHTMTPDGALHIDENVFTAADQPILYRLRTEHFQLAKFSGRTRSADEEMLKLGTIISEEDIERDYNIIYSLDMENWPAPKTSDVVAYHYHFPWDFTELSYHYPVGDGEGEIPASKRIFTTAMPGKGEYCFINKFVAPTGPNTQNAGVVFECMDGAENGYMLCVNAAQKRTTIMNFEYDQLSCSGQQIYLVANYCNPVQNNYDPQITADLEGWDGSQWMPIYRYKSGKIAYHAPSEQHWYQMALPIDREHIKDYRKFRCRAEIDGAPNRNCHLLIDRLRFIEKARGFTVFQSKASCISDNDSVSVLIRLNYKADPDLYQPGKLVAYQFQKWDNTANGGAGGYVPMNASTDNGNGTYTAQTYATGLQVAPGYMKDAFTTKESVETPSLKTLAGNDYGYVMIPEADYDPSASNTVGGQSAKRRALIEQAITKLGLTEEAANARRAFINESGNVRTFDQVMNNDVLFGGATPHVKSFVKEGDNWVIYLATRLPVSATGDKTTFRIGMTVMNDLEDKPTFTEEECATFHIFKIKQTTALNIDGASWTNHPRSWYDGSTGRKLLAANETYRASVALQLDPTIFGSSTANPRCKFDLLHATENVRANDAAFEAKYGCTRTQFKDDMEAFRIDDERNPLREITDWSQVTWQGLAQTGRTEAVAKAIYNRLNHLVTSGLLEIGLDYRDIYMGDRADSYFYLSPIPASGRVDLVNGAAAGGDTTIHTSVCNDTIWLELHSEAPTAKLRFGYDSRVGDTYIVPTIRASRSEANGLDSKHLNVRVAEISTTSDAYNVVIGWEKTELIGSNDPNWSDVKQFKYTQNIDMRNHKPSETEYYTKGDVIEFTPAAGNDITLKAGYWYQFKAPFYAVSKLDEYTADPVTPTGHSQFILAIAPDTVRWTPSHPDAANYWNDDSNWTPVMHNTPEGGFKATVPMGDTKVIIPHVEEGMAPIASDNVVESKDTLHYGYAKNTCSAILFYPNAQILGQEKLTYDKAYVDVPLTTGTWMTFSPALDDVYAGDMYIPFSTSYNKADPASGASTDTVDFAPKSFPYGEGSKVNGYNPRVYPFAFYQGFYNSAVPVAFYNTDKEGTPIETTMTQSTSSVDWVKTNALDMYYAPGKACVLTGYDAYDADDRPLVIRLPKPEDSYCGFGKNGGTTYDAGPAVSLTRPDKLNRNLAYDQYADGFSTEDGLTYTLTNASESEIFFFGNPTMSLVDVYRLCVANADVLKHDAGTYSFTAYNLIEDGNYIVKTITGPGQFFIAPMRAVGLIANATRTAAKTLPIKLTPSALVAITGEGTIVHSSDIRPLPRRAIHIGTTNEKRLYIAASNETDWGVKKAYLTLGEQDNANRGYRFGEDALSITSGLNYYSNQSFSTPLSLYTIADNEALMQDIRDTLNRVPVVFATLDNHFSFDEYTFLTFALQGYWDKPIYLYDALTGDSIRIMDGMQIAVETPVSNQLRYFINGGGIRSTEQTTGGEEIATGIDNNGGLINGDASLNDGRTRIYDVLGRQVAVLGENDLLTQLKLPTGVYVITRGDKTERVVIR